jgi:hypothetical protein
MNRKAFVKRKIRSVKEFRGKGKGRRTFRKGNVVTVKYFPLKNPPNRKEKKNPPPPPVPEPPMKDLTDAPVKFCLNCDDMEDLAVSEESKELQKIKDRFRNCNDTGRFQGDVCSRLFVAAEVNDTELFEDDSKD